MNPYCSLQTNPLFVLFLEPQEFSNQDVCSRLSYLMEGGHLKQLCFAGCKQTLPNATQPIGKIQPFSKKADTFEPVHVLFGAM